MNVIELKAIISPDRLQINVDQYFYVSLDLTLSATASSQESIGTSSLTLRLDTPSLGSLKEAFQLGPYIQRLEFQGNRLDLGPLTLDEGITIFLEFSIGAMERPGQRRLVRLTVEYDRHDQAGRRNREWVDLLGEFVPEMEDSGVPLANGHFSTLRHIRSTEKLAKTSKNKELQIIVNVVLPEPGLFLTPYRQRCVVVNNILNNPDLLRGSISSQNCPIIQAN